MAPASESARDTSGWTRAEQVARTSYGRLLAILAAPSRDIALAEDALAAAFEQALRSWPDAGVPENPDAWILSVARNRQRDVYKSAARRTSTLLEDGVYGAAAVPFAEIDPDAIPDRRLALLFVCAHPAIDRSVRTPLMLQTVLGIEARQVARAFAIPTSTMAQRLVRAKRRIRDARIPFVVPDRTQMPGRLDAVLEAVYGAYAIDWQGVAGPSIRESLAGEAHFLAITLAELLADEPEVLGLAGLISLSLSRGVARGPNEFVPLEEQDTDTWDRALIALGEQFLHRARAFNRIGRFQLEGAIQSVHCSRAFTGETDWKALHKLYSALIRVSPTLGAQVAFAAALGRTAGHAAGLKVLDQLSGETAQQFQPAWATRAHLLEEAGAVDEAKRAYEKAISLTTETGVRRYLERRLHALGDASSMRK